MTEVKQFVIDGWNPAATLGNVMLIIIISYVLSDIIINKKQNVIQLLGKILIVVICMFIIFIRRN